jgi:parallel beta-helix repeat protein
MRKFFTLLVLLVLVVASISAQNPFGNGSNGALTVTVGQTLTINTDRTAVTGSNSQGTQAILVSSSSGFQAGDEILIISMQDPQTNMAENVVGQWETLVVVSVGTGVLFLENSLQHSYNAELGKKHQVVKIPQYTDVNIAGTLNCPAWDGTTGGILYFRSNGSVIVNASGTITSSGKGYRGGTQYGDGYGGGQGGESFVGIGGNGGHYTADPQGKTGAGGGGAAYNGYNGGNGIAGGGGGSTGGSVGLGSVNLGGAGGGGGGYAGSAGGAGYGTFGYGGFSYNTSNNGLNGGENFSGNGGSSSSGGGGGGGGTYGSAELTKLYLGSGGGCGGTYSGGAPGFGGSGGGLLFISSNAISCAGSIVSNGGNGGNFTYAGGGGGGASGGSVYLEAVNINLSNAITSSGGTGGTSYTSNGAGIGGKGRIRLNYNTLANTGQINPAPYLGQFNNIFHTELSNTNNPAGPYPVSALIIDNDGNPITQAKLYYRINGGAFVEVAMTASKSGQQFNANIPGQAINTTIEYYITATDGTDNYIAPLGAPAELYSFKISGFPPYGLTSTDLNNGTVRLNWNHPLSLTNFTNYTIYRSEQRDFTPGAFNILTDNLNDTTFVDATVADFHTYYYVVSAKFNYSGTINESFSGQSAGLLVNNTGQTTVLGYAFLEGRNNHANIKVKFVPLSPSAVADSVYTNALGFFENHNIFPGVYSVRFIKTGFQTPILIENITIVADKDLGESTLYDLGTTYSGNVSGTWSNFASVSGDITVPAGDSLIIEAGTIVRFLGNYNFLVYGYLTCNGAVGDTILITSGPANQVQAPNQWKGIDFYNSADDNSYLHYTKVEYAYDGIYLEWASPAIENCLIQLHSRYGMYLHQSNASIKDSHVQDCSDRGITLNYSSPLIENCLVNNCTNHGISLENYSNPAITACNLNYNNYGIVAASNSDPFIDGCTFTGNTTNGIHFNTIWGRGLITNNTFTGNGKGIFLYYQSSPQIRKNLFIQNSYGIEYQYDCDATVTENTFVKNSYGIVFNTSSYYCETSITKNTFAYNTNDGIHKNNHSYGDNPTIKYNTIIGNGGDGIEINQAGTEIITNNNIVENGGYGIRAAATIETFENNNINSNTAGAISNLTYLPSATWNFVSVNPNNNASCDIYRNINEDPRFVLSDTLDFTLQNGSKCIDGGTATVTDPDGTISDIGAFPFEHGNPHKITVTGFGNQTVSLAWDHVVYDSLVEYKVYYKVATNPIYSLIGSTVDTAFNLTGLTNNVLYDFTVSGIFPGYESGYAPKVSEKPGVPELEFNPGSYSLVIPTGQTSQAANLTLTNSGTRDLQVSFPAGNENSGNAYFDGTGDYVSCGSGEHMGGMTALTMECWLYRENNGHLEFMGKNYRNFHFAIEGSNRLYFYKGYGTPESYSNQGWNTNYTINANQWYHLAVTWEGNTVKMFVNGNQVYTATDAQTGPIPDFIGYNFQLGRRSDENSYYLKGKMAEARLWNVARSQDQIRKNMYQPIGGTEAGLIGYWPLQDDFNDHSTYGLTASVAGNTVLQTSTALPYVLYTVPQEQYTVAPGSNQVVPITFYNRTDLTSIFFTTSMIANDADEPETEIEVALKYGETVPATPVHFVPVAATGKPYSIYISGAKIDDTTIAIGDEIAVFDGALCVGAGIYNGTFNFIFTAWESDPGQGFAGFTPGHAMSFKMYDTSADLETNEAEETYFIGNDTFGYGAFSALSLEASVYNIQNVAVTGGQFNLVSFNLLPHYPNAWSVFGNLPGLQIAYNDAGGVLIPGYNINTIGDINFRDGFYIYADQNGSIAYEGTYIHVEDWDITVEPNKWNYVSMLSRNPVAVTDVFAGLESSISIVQSASGASWIPSQSINTIGNMQPGLGYKIALAVPASITFNYPAGSKGASSILESGTKTQKPTRQTEFFTYTETGLPYAVIVKLKSPQESVFNLVPGNEIGLFDGNQCVGAAIYEGGDQILITAWENDESQNLTGFANGNRITARVYRENFVNTTKHNLTSFTGGIPVYGEGNYAKVVLEVIPANEEPFGLDVLPNPFKDLTSVILEIRDENLVKVKVYDNTGRLVKSLADDHLLPDTYRLTWDGTDLHGKKLNPGVYFIIAETTGNTITKKVIILQ